MASTKTLLLATAFATIMSFPAFATDAPSPDAPADAMAAPADLSAPPAVTSEEDVAPAMAPAPSAEMAAPDATGAAPEMAAEPAPLMDTATPEPTPAPAADTAAPAEPVVEPTIVAEPEPAPAPAPVKKKVSPSAKLSALSKKYDLISLDTDQNRSLSKAEFTAGGFSNDKVFRRFDADNNGKLTNSEINAYASVIEANSKK